MNGNEFYQVSGSVVLTVSKATMVQGESTKRGYSSFNASGPVKEA